MWTIKWIIEQARGQEKISTFKTFLQQMLEKNLKGRRVRPRRCFAMRQKRPSFMRRDKAADRWLERKNMASLSGCEEEVNSKEGMRESETKRGK